MYTAILLLPLVAIAAQSAPDTLVVCAAEFRPALVEWQTYRSGQGREILVADPPAHPEQLQLKIRSVAGLGRLKYVVLVGDVAEWNHKPRTTLVSRDARTPSASDWPTTTIPTNYEPARINTRWGSPPAIAADAPYADVDGDQVPDLAIGRIPCDTTEELAAVMRKVLRYERDAKAGAWERKLNIVSGVGGFGAVADALIEAAGRQVIQQSVPTRYEIRHTSTKSAGTGALAPGEFGAGLRRQLSEDSLAWIYLGHGLPTRLASVATPRGQESLLSVDDVQSLRCGTQSPLAVLIACYTGAVDMPRDCLAEELLLAPQGPLAVIAATRVTMPYGNTVLGHELLRACFADAAPALGDILLLAQRRTMQASANDSLRESLDSLAQGISPPPVDLAAERREHVLMYHLLGDPLLRLRRPQASVAQANPDKAVTK